MSKQPNLPSPWKHEFDCSEKDVERLASLLAGELRAGDRVLLEGPMGVGKTTFARQLLKSLGVHQPPEGSPSFAIAHEYDSPRGGVVHIDYYRLKHELEIDEAGIPSYYWERNLIVISEWLSSWPEFEKQVLLQSEYRVWRVFLAFAADHDSHREIEISLFRK